MYDFLKLVTNLFDPNQVQRALALARRSLRAVPINGSCRGQYGNLWVKLNQNSLWIEGSLAKQLLGENVRRLSAGQVKPVLEELCQDLGLDPARTFVCKLEFGCSLSVSQPPALYLACLEAPPRYGKLEYNGNETVYFKTKSLTYAFYNKSCEVNRHQCGPPDSRFPPNLLRYELRITRGVHRVLGLPHRMTVEDLWSPPVLMELVTHWLFGFESIPKRSRYLPLEAPGSSREVDEYYAICGILAQGGMPDLEHVLAAGRENGTMSRSTASRLRTKYRLLIRPKVGSLEADRMNELNQLVRSEADKMRREIQHAS